MKIPILFYQGEGNILNRSILQSDDFNYLTFYITEEKISTILLTGDMMSFLKDGLIRVEGILRVSPFLRNFFYLIILKNGEKCKAKIAYRWNSNLGLPVLDIKKGYHFYEVLKKNINTVKRGKHYFKIYIIAEAKYIETDDINIYTKDLEEFKKMVEEDMKIFESFVNFFKFKVS